MNDFNIPTKFFDILEKGGITDRGNLVRIENEIWAVTGEIMPITAVFKNTGPRTVSARFKGEITYNGKVVKIIDTDILDAEPGEVVQLQTFFKPTKAGQYSINGRVHFNNKLTTEKGSIINVNQGDGISLSGINYFWYLAVILIIVIFSMLILIKKKKHSHHRRRHISRIKRF